MQLKLNILEKQSNKNGTKCHCIKQKVVDLGADGKCRGELIQQKHWQGEGLSLLASQRRTVRWLCDLKLIRGVTLGCVSLCLPGAPESPFVLTDIILFIRAGEREFEAKRDTGEDDEDNQRVEYNLTWSLHGSRKCRSVTLPCMLGWEE